MLSTGLQSEKKSFQDCVSPKKNTNELLVKSGLSETVLVVNSRHRPALHDLVRSRLLLWLPQNSFTSQTSHIVTLVLNV